MKAILVTGVTGLVIIGGLHFAPSVQDSVKETIEVEKITEVDVLQKRIDTAIEANQATTLEAAQKAYDAVVESEKKRISDEVKADYIAEIEATISSESAYWREAHKIKRLIKKAFPEDPEVAIAVATCESGLKAHAYNPTNTNGSTDGGLWQLNSVHDKELSRLGLDKFNPVDATEFARILYERNEWNDWVCFTHNKLVMR